MGVVGDDGRDVQLLRDVEQAVADPRLISRPWSISSRNSSRAEDVAPLGGGLERFFLLAKPQPVFTSPDGEPVDAIRPPATR